MENCTYIPVGSADARVRYPFIETQEERQEREKVRRLCANRLKPLPVASDGGVGGEGKDNIPQLGGRKLFGNAAMAS